MSKEIGFVVGETGTNKFMVALPNAKDVMENEYVIVNVNERNNERVVVGRIMKLGALSHLLTHETGFSALEKLVESEIDNAKTFAEVEVLGYLDEYVVKYPRNPPLPGVKVYVAPKELLEKFYHVSELPMYVGTLLAREDVRIHLNPKGFMRHLAIIGQTGGGKSYTTGVIIEELYRIGGSIVVIDPHADYVRMSTDEKGNKIIKRFSVFRNPQSTGRYENIDTKELQVSIKDLDPDDIGEILGLKPNAKRMQGLIAVAMDILSGEEELAFEDFENLILNWANGLEKPPKGYKVDDAINVMRYIRRAKQKGLTSIFSNKTTPLESIIAPKHISVLDLSGLKNEVQDIYTKIFLEKIYEQNTSGSISPVFVIIEEAHNFVPQKDSTKSAEIIKKIAAEGRKFGVFLILITQRPQKINQDALSQANSYILLRLKNPQDIYAVKTAAESLGDDLSSLLPTLNPGEAVIVGPVVNLPAIVKIRKRLTIEGGGDIDIIGILKSTKDIAE